MESLWPSSFSDNVIETPNRLLETQAKYLPKLTGDLVYAEIVSLNSIPHRVDYGCGKKPFNYAFKICGKFLENYNFRCFSIHYDIVLYPCFIFIDRDIAKDLKMDQLVTLEDEVQFRDVLAKILNSDQLKLVISSIISLSQ